MRHSRRCGQLGMGLFGMLFLAILIAFIGLVAVRVLPTINEYLTIEKAVKKVLDENPGSVPAIRTAFDRQKDIEYSISSISGSDLEVSQQGDKTNVSYAYEREVPVIEPVFLLIKYKGSHTK
ncbi:DUF4845 domain-containing protein [Ideonella alba]|uniref:DUF4845 domain-containing protein n=1 Tax=Ideonella alba TaxID=2824118 RepID=A0A941BAC6_9BURK|nr:DUF4845 domain-containing protein [Ideonella alba]MBQ0929670.1 DUF4845 domain-containing protein [Ideonella alba]